MLGESIGSVRTRAWRARAQLGRVVAAMLGMRHDGNGEHGHGRPEER